MYFETQEDSTQDAVNNYIFETKLCGLNYLITILYNKQKTFVNFSLFIYFQVLLFIYSILLNSQT